jgi:hypothetical protein
MLKKIVILLVMYIFYIQCFCFPLTQGHNKSERFTASHDDMQCSVETTSTASALGTITVRDSGFQTKSFQNANDDVAFLAFQFSHRKKLATNCDSVHIHTYLPSAPSAGNTVIFDYAYTWYNNMDTIPALSSWSVGRTTYTFTGSEAQYSTPYIPVVTNLTVPANEGYSSILLVKITRDSTGTGSDTYADDLGIMYFDAHFITDRKGSYNEATD